MDLNSPRRNWTPWIVGLLVAWSLLGSLGLGWLGHHTAAHQAPQRAVESASRCPF